MITHAAAAFSGLTPNATEEAVIDLAEKVSAAPMDSVEAAEYVGDTYKLRKAEAVDLLLQTEHIGFCDSEDLGSGNKLLFNGHLFRREQAQKVQAVLQSLSPDDVRHTTEFDDTLKNRGCITQSEAEKILGRPLFEKLHAIGMFDVNEVSNRQESVVYVTRPAAFGKFGDAFVDDALDLAKAFVTCLTYGMTRSSSSRGKIQMLTALMRKLIRGDSVGPATAIGEDYKALELKRVIALQYHSGGMYYMRLLKKEVGQLALQVLTEGDASEHSLPNFPGAAVSTYTPPEVTRVAARKRQTQPSRKSTMGLLNALRTGKR